MNELEASRAGLFIGGFALWSVAEALWPRRARRYRRMSRWRTNLSLGVANYGDAILFP